MNFWDIHNHILPGVDDGSSCMDESLLLISQEYKQGVRNIIVTPHYRNGMFTISSEERYEMFVQLSEKVKELYSDVNLMLGCELFLDSESLTNASDLNNRMRGANVVLVEFSYGVSYATMVELLSKLSGQGLRVIVAHIERYKCLREDINRVSELRDKGYFMQVNSDAVIGRNGFFVRRFVARLLSLDYIDFVASDCHDVDKRTVSIGKANERITKKYGAELAKRVFADNAEKLFGRKGE